MYFQLGDFKYIVLNTGQFTSDVNTLFSTAPQAEVAAALDKHHLNGAELVFQMHPLFVDTGHNRVIIDPGGGYEALINALAEAEIDPASIDTVIFSHGHPDHYNGCIDSAGNPAFVQARYFIQRAEWAHWTDKTNPDTIHTEPFCKLLQPMEDRFTLLDGDGEIVPGIEAIHTPGHTPGLMVVLIGGKLIYMGDTIFSVLHVEHPEWYATFEIRPEGVVESRHKLFQRIMSDNLWVATYHFPMPGTGRIIADGDRWIWKPEIVS